MFFDRSLREERPRQAQPRCLGNVTLFAEHVSDNEVPQDIHEGSCLSHFPHDRLDDITDEPHIVRKSCQELPPVLCGGYFGWNNQGQTPPHKVHRFPVNR